MRAKKYTSLVLAAMMSVSLVACGSNAQTETEPVTKYNLGDTVSTDIVEFTLDSAVFSYYASSLHSSYTEPIESDSGGIFATTKGHTFVCMQFEMTNTDRGSLHVADDGLSWYVNYKEESYPIMNFDLNQKDGSGFLRLSWSAIGTSADNLKKHGSNNKIMKAGESMVVRTLGQVNMEPDNLTDGFDISISLPNSSGEEEIFVYTVE